MRYSLWVHGRQRRASGKGNEVTEENEGKISQTAASLLVQQGAEELNQRAYLPIYLLDFKIILSPTLLRKSVRLVQEETQLGNEPSRVMSFSVSPVKCSFGCASSGATCLITLQHKGMIILFGSSAINVPLWKSN